MYTSRRRTHIVFSVILFSILLVLFFTKTNSPKTSNYLKIRRHLLAAKSTCEGTIYTNLCLSTLSSLPNLASKSMPQIISATVHQTAEAVVHSQSNFNGIRKNLPQFDSLEKIALDDCLELLDDTIYELDLSASELSPNWAPKNFHNIKTYLSAVITNQYTCLDGFNDTNGMVKVLIQDSLNLISQLVSNSLAMLNKIPHTTERDSKGIFSEYGEVTGGFPSWVSKKDRRLLQTSVNNIKVDLSVDKNGSGNYMTIGEAVGAAPYGTNQRFVIYIKEGVYLENVEVVREKRNLMFIGDGIGKTVVQGGRNVVDGWTNFRTATVAVTGEGFLARDITFENTAGPSKHQAVALQSGSDFSAFYRCSFEGYQDTLYVHSLRQFYRECDIYGTVDFIFGDAVVVFQNCNLYARMPNSNQKNIFTAQGRVDPNQNTGISIQNCNVTAASDLIPVKSSFQTYLGRPWKTYSRTVFMESFLDDLIDPAGWLEWSGDFALSTLYYREYNNRGPGANTSARVTWPGYKVINNSAEASQFTVESFIQGNEWLTSTAVPFYSGFT
ncbi:pectinesterase-like [Tasmannia lanceolata]|uniref:pectinesterase-like n=1 Tax=Tasmannia lanceolata TaxID=3420 RepID=UPI0040630FB2